eukprot:2773723-Lingulodinium_polyedra.AAC.1
MVPGGLPEFVAHNIRADRHIFLARDASNIPGPVFATAACIGGAYRRAYTARWRASADSTNNT